MNNESYEVYKYPSSSVAAAIVLYLSRKILSAVWYIISVFYACRRRDEVSVMVANPSAVLVVKWIDISCYCHDSTMEGDSEVDTHR